MDIDIPYIVGVVAPYHLTIMNYITFDIQKYTAVQNEDGGRFLSRRISIRTIPIRLRSKSTRSPARPC